MVFDNPAIAAAFITATAVIVGATISAMVNKNINRIVTNQRETEMWLKAEMESFTAQQNQIRDERISSEAQHKARREQAKIAMECQRLASDLSNLTWRTGFSVIMDSGAFQSKERSHQAETFRQNATNTLSLLKTNLYFLANTKEERDKIDTTTKETMLLCQFIWLELTKNQNYNAFLHSSSGTNNNDINTGEYNPIALEKRVGVLLGMTDNFSKRISKSLTSFFNDSSLHG